MYVFPLNDCFKAPLLINLVVKRYFFISSVEQKKFANQQGRFLAKALNHGTKKKKNWFISEPSSYVPFPQAVQAKVPKNERRVAVLNKLFMKNISSLMATGEVSPEIIGKGIEISKVKVASDINQVNVYWCAKGNETDLVTEETLTTIAGRLRHELSQLRVMGVVPKIQFVKDKSYSKTADVERLLLTADFGEDYIPSAANNFLHSQFCIDSQKQIATQLSSTTTQDQSDELDKDETLPVMRMDVLGLDHGIIMDKIEKSMKKSQHTKNISYSENSSFSLQDKENAFEFLSSKQRQQELQKFLSNRKAMMRRANQKNYQPEMELYERELENSYHDDDLLEYDTEESDFIDEEDRL